MTRLFTPILRAIGQLDDPAMLRVLLQSLALSLLCFAGIAAGLYWLVHHYLAADGTLGVIAGALGSLAALVSALWLFLPVAVVIASLFMEPVCRAVERRWYPGLPPAKGASLAVQLWDGFSIALRVLALSVLSLIVSLLLPGLGHVLGWAITAWALGRGLFASVALRRLPRREALAAYRSRRIDVLIQGAVLTAAGTLPLINLLVPVLAPAVMVHVLLGARAAPSRRFEAAS
jgi:uncharacterized protein involved in cysteine biosynthesis